MGSGFFEDLARGEIGNGMVDLANMEVYVCRPETFEEMVVDALVRLSVEGGRIRREGFANSFSQHPSSVGHDNWLWPVGNTNYVPHLGSTGAQKYDITVIVMCNRTACVSMCGMFS